MGPSNCIILEKYLHNYRTIVTAAYNVRYHTLQVVIYPQVSHSSEQKTAGDGILAFHIMADTLSNYHAQGPHFNFGERIWPRVLLRANFRALYSLLSQNKQEMSRKLQQSSQDLIIDLISLKLHSLLNAFYRRW